MSMRSQRQREEQQMKFTFTASTLALKTCRQSSGQHAMQRELCSTSVASTVLQSSISAKISATTLSSSVSRAEEVHITKRGRRTGRQTHQSFLWLLTRLVTADWKLVWRSSALPTTRLCLHLKCRRNWTQRACRTFLWSKRV